LGEHSADVIIRFNHNYQAVFVNPALERLTGIARYNFIGKTRAEVGLPEEMCRLFETNLITAFENGQEILFEYQRPPA
jgi:PAS domain S-box-containing protein